MSALPGYGDEATWPPYTGHPNDPRASEDEVEYRAPRRRRFRWTRRTYRHAHQLARLLARYHWELWEHRHEQPDPLATPIRQRLDRFRGDSDIPF